MGATVLETPRLRLRDWNEGDIEPFMAALNTPEVTRWLGGVQDAAQFRAAYDRILACRAEHGHCFWIMERRADGAMLGFCGLKRVNSSGAPMTGDMEIGWRLRTDAQGQGYAREAAQACLDAAFHRFGAPHVVALTVRGNIASWGLMQRLGMVRAPEWDFTGGFAGDGDESIITYRIDKKDWTQ